MLATLEVHDSLEIKKSNLTHCLERKFELRVADAENDPLAGVLLKTLSTNCDSAASCFHMNTTNNYRINMYLRASEDEYENK